MIFHELLVELLDVEGAGHFVINMLLLLEQEAGIFVGVGHGQTRIVLRRPDAIIDACVYGGALTQHIGTALRLELAVHAFALVVRQLRVERVGLAEHIIKLLLCRRVVVDARAGPHMRLLLPITRTL